MLWSDSEEAICGNSYIFEAITLWLTFQMHQVLLLWFTSTKGIHKFSVTTWAIVSFGIKWNSTFIDARKPILYCVAILLVNDLKLFHSRNICNQDIIHFDSFSCLLPSKLSQPPPLYHNPLHCCHIYHYLYTAKGFEIISRICKGYAQLPHCINCLLVSFVNCSNDIFISNFVKVGFFLWNFLHVCCGSRINNTSLMCFRF